LLGKEVNSYSKAQQTNHIRRTPKRVDRGKFSAKTIKEICERDGYQCVRCGSYHLEKVPHHIIYKSQGGLGEKRNGASICIECHILAHKLKEVREWFEIWRDKTLDENGDYYS
jgi:5-methylcytosine-specific restriction endonuclease McrA